MTPQKLHGDGRTVEVYDFLTGRTTRRDTGIEGRILISCVRNFGVDPALRVARYAAERPHKVAGVVLLDAPYPHAEVWDHLPREVQEQVIDRGAIGSRDHAHRRLGQPDVARRAPRRQDALHRAVPASGARRATRLATIWVNSGLSITTKTSG